MSMATEIARWIGYRQDYDARPKFWHEETEGTGLRAPWILSIASFLEEHSNMTEREVMTAPLGLMLWKSAALAEQLGMTRSDIMTEKEEQIVALIEKTRQADQQAAS